MAKEASTQTHPIMELIVRLCAPSNLDSLPSVRSQANHRRKRKAENQNWQTETAVGVIRALKNVTSIWGSRVCSSGPLRVCEILPDLLWVNKRVRWNCVSQHAITIPAQIFVKRKCGTDEIGLASEFWATCPSRAIKCSGGNVPRGGRIYVTKTKLRNSCVNYLPCCWGAVGVTKRLFTLVLDWIETTSEAQSPKNDLGSGKIITYRGIGSQVLSQNLACRWVWQLENGNVNVYSMSMAATSNSVWPCLGPIPRASYSNPPSLYFFVLDIAGLMFTACADHIGEATGNWNRNRSLSLSPCTYRFQFMADNCVFLSDFWACCWSWVVGLYFIGARATLKRCKQPTCSRRKRGTLTADDCNIRNAAAISQRATRSGLAWSSLRNLHAHGAASQRYRRGTTNARYKTGSRRVQWKPLNTTQKTRWRCSRNVWTRGYFGCWTTLNAWFFDVWTVSSCRPFGFHPTEFWSNQGETRGKN